MNKNDKSLQIEAFKERTKALGLRVIKLCQSLPRTYEASILGKQILRSATSVAANYRAPCRGRSDAETYSKMCIVVEEADETLLWLEFIRESGFVSAERTKPLSDDYLEIVKIINTIRIKIKAKIDATKIGKV